MPCWHCHHQRIVPDWQGDDAIASFIGAGEPHVVQVVIQTFDLLRQRHLEQADFDFGFLLPAQRQQPPASATA